MDTPGTTTCFKKKTPKYQILVMSSLLKMMIESDFLDGYMLSWFLSAEPGKLRLDICYCCQIVAERDAETIELIVQSSGPRAPLKTVTQVFFWTSRQQQQSDRLVNMLKVSLTSMLNE